MARQVNLASFIIPKKKSFSSNAGTSNVGEATLSSHSRTPRKKESRSYLVDTDDDGEVERPKKPYKKRKLPDEPCIPNRPMKRKSKPSPLSHDKQINPKILQNRDWEIFWSDDRVKDDFPADWYVAHIGRYDSATNKYKVHFVGEEDKVYEMIITRKNVRPCVASWLKRTDAMVVCSNEEQLGNLPPSSSFHIEKKKAENENGMVYFKKLCHAQLEYAKSLVITEPEDEKKVGMLNDLLDIIHDGCDIYQTINSLLQKINTSTLPSNKRVSIEEVGKIVKRGENTLVKIFHHSHHQNPFYVQKFSGLLTDLQNINCQINKAIADSSKVLGKRSYLLSDIEKSLRLFPETRPYCNIVTDQSKILRLIFDCGLSFQKPLEDILCKSVSTLNAEKNCQEELVKRTDKLKRSFKKRALCEKLELPILTEVENGLKVREWIRNFIHVKKYKRERISFLKKIIQGVPNISPIPRVFDEEFKKCLGDMDKLKKEVTDYSEEIVKYEKELEQGGIWEVEDIKKTLKKIRVSIVISSVEEKLIRRREMWEWKRTNINTDFLMNLRGLEDILEGNSPTIRKKFAHLKSDVAIDSELKKYGKSDVVRFFGEVLEKSNLREFPILRSAFKNKHKVSPSEVEMKPISKTTMISTAKKTSLEPDSTLVMIPETAVLPSIPFHIDDTDISDESFSEETLMCAEKLMFLTELDPPRWGWSAMGGIVDVLPTHERTRRRLVKKKRRKKRIKQDANKIALCRQIFSTNTEKATEKLQSKTNMQCDSSGAASSAMSQDKKPSLPLQKESSNNNDDEIDIFCYDLGRAGQESFRKVSRRTDTNHSWKPKSCIKLQLSIPLTDDLDEDAEPEFIHDTFSWNLTDPKTPTPMQFAIRLAAEWGLSFGQTLDICTSIQEQIDRHLLNSSPYSPPISFLDPCGLERIDPDPSFLDHPPSTTKKKRKHFDPYETPKQSRIKKSKLKLTSNNSSVKKGRLSDRRSDLKNRTGSLAKGSARKYNHLAEVDEEVEQIYKDEVRVRAQHEFTSSRDPILKEVLNHICHICKLRKRSAAIFVCGIPSHCYCTTHISARLNLDVHSQCAKQTYCPICCLDCYCARCTRRLDAVAWELKQQCLAQGKDLKEVKFKVSLFISGKKKRGDSLIGTDMPKGRTGKGVKTPVAKPKYNGTDHSTPDLDCSIRKKLLSMKVPRKTFKIPATPPPTTSQSNSDNTKQLIPKKQKADAVDQLALLFKGNTP